MADPTCVELFAGAGGASLGLRAAGYRCLAHAEYDPDACATLREAGFDPVLEGDLREWKPERLEPDLLWSSFPCQAWSTAGKREGANDDRNGWPWTVEKIDQLAPTWVICENVPGLTYHTSECKDSYRGAGPQDCPGCYFHDVILAQLADRFNHVIWGTLDAASFGVPQDRRRVFIVAGPARPRWPAPTHGAHPSLFSTLEPLVSIGEALGLSNPVRQQSTVEAGALPRAPGEPSPTVSTKGTLYEEAATGRRRLTVEECAILQDFPTDHPFQGTSASRYKQVGNACPPTFSRLLGLSVLAAGAT